MAITVYRRFRARQGSAPDNSTVLEDGEFGYDTTKKITKIGDGVTPWSELRAFSTTTPMFSFTLDDDGNLYVEYEDGSTAPAFEYDAESGNLYYVFNE